MTRLLGGIAALTLGVFAAQAAAENLGHYERIDVPGPALEGNLGGNDTVRKVSVYLPPSYGRDPDRRYPVIYLLHGFTDSDERWFGLEGEHFVNVPSAVDAAWEAGAGEVIIVMPNAFTRFWGSMYSSSVTTGNWEGYVAEDLVAHVDARYRTLAKRESRGIAGHSMGGYGALRIGMKRPDVFSGIYAMSPCCMAPNVPDVEALTAAAAVQTAEQVATADFGVKAMLASAAAWSPNPANPPLYYDLPLDDGRVDPDVVALWAANAPLAMVHQYIPALKEYEAIHFDAGDRDFGIVQTVHRLDAVLDAYGIEHVAEEYEGDHVNRVHERITTKLMPMFTEALAFE
ncbi:MAG: prolyl oligopeptidase family serine peptidase [Gammaproteobacteria bacterium]|nr:prolyl oligopeptidase family serine peptidase [Gammaproteobacteria bacterium]